MAARFEVMTGVPHCIASTIGSPKLSQSDGYSKARAPAYNEGKSDSGDLPRSTKESRMASRSSSTFTFSAAHVRSPVSTSFASDFVSRLNWANASMIRRMFFRSYQRPENRKYGLLI